MNSRRLLIALLLALLLSGAVTLCRQPQTCQPRRSPSEYRSAMLRRRMPLQAGDVLKPEDLVLVDWPASIALSKPSPRSATWRAGR